MVSFTFNATVDGAATDLEITEQMFLDYDLEENGGNEDGILDETEFTNLLIEGLNLEEADAEAIVDSVFDDDGNVLVDVNEDGVVDENDEIGSLDELMTALDGTEAEEEETGEEEEEAEAGEEDMAAGESCNGG